MGQSYYLRVATASDLKDVRERRLYRFFEMLPGMLSWGTIGGAVLASWLFPTQTAFFIILFVVYWTFRTVYFSLHLHSSYQKMRANEKENWLEKVKIFPQWRDLWHLVIVASFKEPYEVLRESVQSLKLADYPKDRMLLVLALEERAGKAAAEKAELLSQEFQNSFAGFLATFHPADLPGEIPGKGSNEAFAEKEAKEKLLDARHLPYDKVIVSAFDADTAVFPQYFSCLSHYYLVSSNPTRTSFQPIPLFLNNIWEAGPLSRIFSFSATFWQMMNQERPEKLITFSSHAMSFKALVDAGFRQPNVVSDDSRIFWQCFLRYDGSYKVQPMYYPVSMDAAAGPSFWATLSHMYKQQRRWAYGVGEVPYFLFGFLKNKKIPFSKKFSLGFELIEGHWSWATASFLIFFLGWLPLIIGGAAFSQTLLSYNLPRLTSRILTVGMVGLVASAFLSMHLTAPKKPEYGRFKLLLFAFQWLLLPFVMIFFSSLPALDAQTRWLFGRPMAFWSTPKYRK